MSEDLREELLLGAPISRAVLVFEALDFDHIATTVSGPDGGYRIELPPGLYSPQVMAEGFENWRPPIGWAVVLDGEMGVSHFFLHRSPQ